MLGVDQQQVDDRGRSRSDVQLEHRGLRHHADHDHAIMSESDYERGQVDARLDISEARHIENQQRFTKIETTLEDSVCRGKCKRRHWRNRGRHSSLFLGALEVTLHEAQALHVQLVAKLITYVYSLGYELTWGEAYRTQEQAQWDADHGIGIAQSVHCDRLAVDLQLFKDGRYLTNSTDYAFMG